MPLTSVNSWEGNCITDIIFAIQVITLANWISFEPYSRGDYMLPQWAQGIGWVMAMSTIVPIPLLGTWVIVRSYKKPGFEGLSFLQV